MPTLSDLLIYTAACTMTAGLLILVKRLLRHRINGRCHLLLWGILLVRVFIPVLPASNLSLYNLTVPLNSSISSWIDGWQIAGNPADQQTGATDAPASVTLAPGPAAGQSTELFPDTGPAAGKTTAGSIRAWFRSYWQFLQASCSIIWSSTGSCTGVCGKRQIAPISGYSFF